mgnify:CR=1 FL=1
MKDFKIIIMAYGYRTSFIVKAEDRPESIENAIVDKLGEKKVDILSTWSGLMIKLKKSLRPLSLKKLKLQTEKMQL